MMFNVDAQAGVQWLQAYNFADAHNVTIVGGTDPTVGSVGIWVQVDVHFQDVVSQRSNMLGRVVATVHYPTLWAWAWTESSNSK